MKRERKRYIFLFMDAPVPTRDGCARGQFLCPVIFLFLGIHGQICCLGKLLYGKIRMVVGKGAPGGNTQRPHIRPGPGRRNPLQRRQNFLRLGLGHLTQHHELIPTDAEDFPRSPTAWVIYIGQRRISARPPPHAPGHR